MKHILTNVFLLVVFFLSCYAVTWIQVAATKQSKSMFSVQNILFGASVTFLFYYFGIGA